MALVRADARIDPRGRAVQKIEPVVLKPDPQSAPENALVFDYFVGDLHLRYVFDGLLKHLSVQHYEKAGKRAVSRTVFAWRDFRWQVAG